MAAGCVRLLQRCWTPNLDRCDRESDFVAELVSWLRLAGWLRLA